MAKSGGKSPRGTGGPKKPARTAQRTPKGPKKPAAPVVALPALPPGPLRVGVIPGATPGKWIDTWQERMPRIPLEVVPIAVADGRRVFDDDEVDVALVRLPLDTDGLHTIPLYDEVTVVVVPVDSHLTAADELAADDLAGEVLITPADDVLGLAVPGTTAPRFPPPETTEEAIATVAAGVGIVIVPMSLARLHQRKDIDQRPLRDAPASRVAIAWRADAANPLVDTFVGIVRGRTANSSR